MKIGQPADKPAATGGGTARPEPNATATTKTMPIKVAPSTGAAAPAGAAGAAPAAAAGTKTADLESSAKVQISRAATTLISSQKAVNADIDAEKVSRVSQQIDDNTYQVDAAAIADKLIANAQELLGKVPK